ncbi:maleylpyruvate isomerase family mycothiol-dependent enzyme [Streptomyces durbertensis]|uniref:Maleylpyruvate isomerase family mycothiol-dependent enzyme n=1 Tax=Streptomyces durbertensis TaxID=2448886 RepID=A0ABR6EFK4_9ACTN|nr:maleylpyruvate isomerase family mycothiol-dependent enzyme [Streptomyces durbertensis]MBB1243254.1 maleylpyruvate isomerase family mycothiol-dependent enzyme [Streptomyces durbertensis]
METSDFITVLGREGHSLISAAEEAGLGSEVPTCPGWHVRDLVLHVGRVHRWATRHVAERLTEPAGLPEAEVPDELLGDWFRDGLHTLVGALDDASDDLRCWTFLRGTANARAFWARRQAHETTIHRVDAELAEGQALSPVDRDLAADGIDELLAGFHTRSRSRVRSPRPLILRVRTTDGAASEVWTMRLTEEEPSVGRGEEGDADCELSGPAELLYLALWNRLPHSGGLTVTGDADVLRLWREKSTIT